VSTPVDERVLGWLDGLRERHLADLSFAEVRRGVQALSTRYVEHRGGIGRGKTLDGAGKRAAFAMFYGPLHFLTLRAIVAHLGEDASVSRIVDLGCGTGVAGAAWALSVDALPTIRGVDLNAWTLDEARRTWRAFGLRGRALRRDLASAELPGRGGGVVAAYALNELEPEKRDAMLERLIDAARRGARVLVVEPISRRAVPWWERWRRAAVDAGGRADTWRFPVELPGRLAELDRAAGLDHAELTARSVWL
jgi:hypothetical protein